MMKNKSTQVEIFQNYDENSMSEFEENLVKYEEDFERYGENLEILLNLVSRFTSLIANGLEKEIQTNSTVMGLRIIDLFDQKDGLPYEQDAFSLRDQIATLIKKLPEYSFFNPETDKDRRTMNTCISMEVIHLYDSLSSYKICSSYPYDEECD